MTAPPEIRFAPELRLCPFHAPPGFNGALAWAWQDGRAVNLCAVCADGEALLGALAPKLAGLQAVIDSATRILDGFERHARLEQARRELDDLVRWHADQVTIAALETTP